MPIQWNVPQHTELARELTAALEEPPGAVLVGPDGSGKSTLTQQAAAGYLAAHPDAVVRRVTGTPTERAVPFGAFAHLIDVAEIGKPAALLRAARESLPGGPDDLLIVDDANQLDQLSATLTYQLARSGQVRMIVTARAEHAPEPIEALWNDGLLPRFDVTSSKTATDIGAFVDDLPGPAREVLDLLTVQEPIPLEDLVALTSAAAVAEAQQLGAVEVLSRGEAELAFTAHPLFAERARADLGARRAALATRLLGRAQARARDHPSDRLRIAGLAVDSDTPLPAIEAVAAAQEALRLGDLPLAERLARGALAQTDSVDARLPLGHALAWQGRGREADDVLGAVDPASLPEDQLMAWALPRAANQFWMLGQPEQATAFLRNTQARVTSPAARATLDALAATFAMNAGNPQRALELARAVLAADAPGEIAIAWAGSAAALSAARMGRLDEVDGFVQHAKSVAHPGLLRFTVGLAQTTVLLLDDDPAGAEEVAQRHTDFAELQQPGRAIGEVLLAQVMLARGEFHSATELLRPASAILDRTGYSWGPLSLMLLTTGLARLGELSDCARTLSRAESRHGTKSALFAPELGLARAARLEAGRDTVGAIAAARQAAGMAERSGQFAVAVQCWQEAMRLGDTRAADPLKRIAAQADCAVLRRLLAELS